MEKPLPLRRNRFLTGAARSWGGSAAPPGARAFSLAELMIAMIILGFGLLIIGAALPVGLTYTRQSSDMSLGDAASAYGLDMVEQDVRLSQTAHRDNLFRPRQGGGPNPGALAEPPLGAPPGFDYEPLIKVRPLISKNINVTPGAGLAAIPDHAEELIRRWFLEVSLVLPPPPPLPEYGETDFAALPYLAGDIDGDGVNDSRFQNPALSALARVYPPVSSNWRFLPTYDMEPQGFFDNPYATTGVAFGEAEKAVERRITWTAFYRRVSYAQYSDPNLYEVIVVAARHPGPGYRFPIQDETAMLGATAPPMPMYLDAPAPPGQSSEDPAPLAANDAGGVGDTLSEGGSQSNLFTQVPGPMFAMAQAQAQTNDAHSPMPWLVLFNALPATMPPLLIDLGTGDRQINPAVPFVEPPTLTFLCSASVGQLLPVGSIFIPAVNDDRPGYYGPSQYDNVAPPPVQRAGFVPHAPTTLPIYEVVERPDTTTVVVKNNGYYPWVNTGLGAESWPVWVIPPSYKERDGTGQPVFERVSPVVSVARRYIRLREIP